MSRAIRFFGAILLIGFLAFAVVNGCVQEVKRIAATPENQYHTGQMLHHKVTDKTVQILEVHRYPDGVKYTIRTSNDLGEISEAWVNEFELENIR